jgi:hypothetical protein
VNRMIDKDSPLLAAPFVAGSVAVIGDNDPDMAIFQQPWWLEAVSDNRYSVVTAGDEKGFFWWPYMFRRWWGFSLIVAPPMTHILGPVIRLPESKQVSAASRRSLLVNEALDQFPRADGFQQVLAPDSPEALPLQTAGHDISVRYTYRVASSRTVDDLWLGLKDSVRNKVRRAQKAFVVHQDLSLMQFHAIYTANLQALGRVNHHSEDIYHRLDQALSRRQRHRIITAVDRRTGRISASLLLVWDAKALYHFRATHDREADSPGASSLLTWEAINIAAELGLTFDSDTFHGPAGAKFMEAFGAEPVARLVATRSSLPLKIALSTNRRISRDRATRSPIS